MIKIDYECCTCIKKRNLVNVNLFYLIICGNCELPKETKNTDQLKILIN